MVKAIDENVLIPAHFGSLLYARSRHEYIPYDHFTTDVIKAAAESSLLKLPRRLAEALSTDQKEAFHSLGKRLAFLDRKGRFLGRIIDRPPPPSRLLGPLTLHLSVTTECDLRCRHCFSSEEMGTPSETPLTLTEMEALFNECKDLGCMRVALTGGEPLNRPDLFEIIDALAIRGIDPCLTTNGMRIDAAVAGELARRPFAWINVSLEGATATTNDAVRGEGTFKTVTAKLKKYMKGRVRYALSVTLNRLNVKELHLLPKLARELGAEALMMRAVYPVGNGAENRDLHLTFEEYERALKTLRETGHPVGVVPTSCEMISTDDDLAVIFENFGCAAGNTVATVYHDGRVSPCSLIEDGVELDSLREKSLAEIWGRGRGFVGIRSIEAPDECASCHVYESCSGGCRARAWKSYGNMEAVDPWCKPALVQRSRGISRQ